jgi:hypothetical protein
MPITVSDLRGMCVEDIDILIWRVRAEFNIIAGILRQKHRRADWLSPTTGRARLELRYKRQQAAAVQQAVKKSVIAVLREARLAAKRARHLKGTTVARNMACFPHAHVGALSDWAG